MSRGLAYCSMNEIRRVDERLAPRALELLKRKKGLGYDITTALLFFPIPLLSVLGYPNGADVHLVGTSDRSAILQGPLRKVRLAWQELRCEKQRFGGEWRFC